MTDRDLLGLAAKAAGIKAQYSENMGDFATGEPYSGNGVRWNPLTDDGDALRLANRLCMSVYTGPCQATANTIPGALRGNFFKEETVHQDQDEAVRRVIVRAAAEIGENMP